MKAWRFLILFLMGSVSYASPIIVPASTTTIAGGQIQFSSTDTVTWSLAAGSSGTISGSGLYTAPKLILANNVVDGCTALPNDHIYNQRIDNLPLDPNSATIISNISSGASAYIQIEPDFPHNIYSLTSPTTGLIFDFTPNNNGNFPYLPFPYWGVENSAIPSDFSRDMHILGVSTTTCSFSEIYKVFPVGADSDCPTTCNAVSGVQYSGMGYNLADTSNGSGGSADAAGMYISPLLTRYSELKAGVINHALRFTMSNGNIFPNFQWPAVANATAASCTPSNHCLKYGSRLRLKASFPITSYSATTQTVLTALKKYGMILADGGSNMHIQMNADVYRDTVTYQALQSEIRFNTTISQWAFDVVDESSLEFSSATGKVNLNNVYETPNTFAEVIATKTSDSSTSTVRVALQPVTVGTMDIPFPANGPVLAVMAGTPQFQIPYWIEGATTTTATFTMSPSTGQLLSSGLFTAPAKEINQISSITITITPSADSTNAFSFPLLVLPSDAIRINVGGKSVANAPAPPYDALGNYGPDALGNYWWTDPTTLGINWETNQDAFGTQSLWVSSNTDPDIGLYYTYKPGISDAAYGVMVPNGAYFLAPGFAVGDPGDGHIAGVNMSIDSQGQTVVSTSQFAIDVGTTNYVSTAIKIPVQVTNNQFYFAMRDVLASSGTVINKWSLTPTILGERLKKGGITLHGGISGR